MKVGTAVETVFGEGEVIAYREESQAWAVRLSYGVLYVPDANLSGEDNVGGGRGGGVILRSRRAGSTVMNLDVAYDLMEKMRKLNFEVMCQERGVPCNHDHCFTCLTEKKPMKTENRNPLDHFCRFVDDKAMAFQKSPPCLVCAMSVCKSHSSPSFRKSENIIMCAQCESLFGMDYLVRTLTSKSKDERSEQIEKLMEKYDRVLLLLQYSEQFIDKTAEALKNATAAQNRVGLGSCGAGILSGVLGFASAVAIFTPAGPPLLIASLLFGGSATAVSTCSDVVHKYISEPNKLADRILAVHGVCRNILRVIATLRDAIVRDHMNTTMYTKTDSHRDLLLLAESTYQQKLEIYPVAAASTAARVMGSSITGAAAVNAAETTVMAGRGARIAARGSSATATAGVLLFAQIAGGTLAAATLVLEAKCMSETILNILAGDPCEKADRLLQVKSDIADLPSTNELQEECDRYLETLTRRQRVMTEDEVAKLLLENEEILQQAQELAMRNESSLPGLIELDDSENSEKSPHRRQDLLKRIQQHKAEESVVSPQHRSLLDRIKRHKRKSSMSPPIDPMIPPVFSIHA